jgi:hypothetical protein
MREQLQRHQQAVDGLGDRERSLSPDDSWDTMLTTIMPDNRLPSAESSFTSAAASFSATSSALSMREASSTDATSVDSLYQYCEDFSSDSDTEADVSDREEMTPSLSAVMSVLQPTDRRRMAALRASERSTARRERRAADRRFTDRADRNGAYPPSYPGPGFPAASIQSSRGHGSREMPAARSNARPRPATRVSRDAPRNVDSSTSPMVPEQVGYAPSLEVPGPVRSFAPAMSFSLSSVGATVSDPLVQAPVEEN